MTYLELCQRLKSEGPVPGTLSTVAGQTGELGRIVDWIASAWQDIENRRSNWAWLRGDYSFNTVADTGTYTPSTVGIGSDFRWWDRNKAKFYLTATGVSDEGELTYLSYADWWKYYNVGTQTADRPQYFAVQPEDSALLLAPVPNDVFTVTGAYWKRPTALSADGDEPAMPADYHMAVVWRAAMYMFQMEEAPARFGFALSQYNDFLDVLEANQLPKARVGHMAPGEDTPLTTSPSTWSRHELDA